MLRINDILDKVQSYLSPSEIGMIEKAYIFSASVHQGQIRLSGEPYLTHPMEVCGILADMKLDAATLVTGLLHDTVEDTLATLEQIEEAFGKEVAFLVDGLDEDQQDHPRQSGGEAGGKFPQDDSGDVVRYPDSSHPSGGPDPQHADARVSDAGPAALHLQESPWICMHLWPIVWESTG